MLACCGRPAAASFCDPFAYIVSTMRAKRSQKSARWGPPSRRRSLARQAPVATCATSRPVPRCAVMMQPAHYRRNLMTHGRLIILAVLTALAVSACSKTSGPGAPAVSGPADTAASTTPQPTQRIEGSPQIATEPDGMHIEYRVYGKGDPVIVLIHGWATDATYWYKQIDPLKAKYTVVAVNLAGHGASSNNRTDWSMGNYGEDVATVVRKLPNPRVIL